MNFGEYLLLALGLSSVASVAEVISFGFEVICLIRL